MNLRKCRKIADVIYLRNTLSVYFREFRAIRLTYERRIINVSQPHPMAYARVCRSRWQPPKVTWQAGSAVRVGAGLPFSQSTTWPLDPARFHRGIETWTVVGGEIPSSIDRRARHAGMPIASLSLRAANCATRSCVMNHTYAHHKDPRSLRRTILPLRTILLGRRSRSWSLENFHRQ